jgi:anti-anti-sigma regulatory factor
MPNVVSYQGRQSIANAESVADGLRDALSAGEAVEIDLSEVAEVDIAFLQILVAAGRTARQRGVPLSCRGVGGRLIEAVARAGLPPSLLNPIKGGTP